MSVLGHVLMYVHMAAFACTWVCLRVCLDHYLSAGQTPSGITDRGFILPQMTPRREWWERSSEGHGEAGRGRGQKAKQQQSEPKMRSEQKTNREDTKTQNDRDPRLTEQAESTSGLVLVRLSIQSFLDRSLSASALSQIEGRNKRLSENSSKTTVPFGQAQSYIFCCLQPTTNSLMCAFLW